MLSPLGGYWRLIRRPQWLCVNQFRFRKTGSVEINRNEHVERSIYAGGLVYAICHLSRSADSHTSYGDQRRLTGFLSIKSKSSTRPPANDGKSPRRSRPTLPLIDQYVAH
ncbi:hypothetical protein FRB95_002787 [Tulasnella sp. JGI-2019a]|nr:hypothetical protein FRB95_002787 [Tulasnella sp. JGI-2019a]